MGLLKRSEVLFEALGATTGGSPAHVSETVVGAPPGAHGPRVRPAKGSFAPQAAALPGDPIPAFRTPGAPVMAIPLIPATAVVQPPQARSSGARPVSSPSLASAALVPPVLSPSPAPVHVAVPALAPAPAPSPVAATAAAHPVPATAPVVVPPTLTDLLGAGTGPDDEPILIVEGFSSPETLFDRTPTPLHARTVSLRYDTAAVGGFVAAILFGVAFMLGRTGATSAETNIGIGPAAAPRPIEVAHAEPEPAPGAAPHGIPLSTSFELEPAPGPTEPAGPVVAPPPAPAAPPPAAPAAPAAADARWGIMAIGGIPKRSADEVVKFLEEKGGVKTSLVGSGENYGVIVGAYADKKSDAFENDLKRVRGLVYKDGKKAFAGAYAYPLRRNR